MTSYVLASYEERHVNQSVLPLVDLSKTKCFSWYNPHFITKGKITKLNCVTSNRQTIFKSLMCIFAVLIDLGTKENYHKRKKKRKAQANFKEMFKV